jgi:hypothetical protein
MAERKKMFDGNEGEMIYSSDAKNIKKLHQSNKKEQLKSTTHNYVEAEFFGMTKFNELMDRYKDKCVGFRVYYGARWEEHSKGNVKVTAEGAGKRTSRLIIVPVDAYGRDLSDINVMGLKDMPGEPSGLAGGPLCPSKCAPPDEDDDEN